MSKFSSALNLISATPIFELSGLRFSRPVFIVSAPRSGSSYLYEVVRRMGNIFSFEQENDLLWHHFFPYEKNRSFSDYISLDEINPRKRRAITIAFFLQHLNRPKMLDRQKINQSFIQTGLLKRQPLRYIEKTIANCFHLEVLDYIFPDSLYIHLVRDGKDTISSMIEGWNSGKFSYRPVPIPTTASIDHWCYPVPFNWEEVIDLPLENICAWNWIEHNKQVLIRHEECDSFRQRYLRIRFEDFQQNPIEHLKTIEDFTSFQLTENTIQFLKSGRNSWSTVSSPKKDKWKEINFEAISRIEDYIQPMMNELGY